MQGHAIVGIPISAVSTVFYWSNHPGDKKNVYWRGEQEHPVNIPMFRFVVLL